MALGAKVDGVDVWGGDASITDVGDRPMVSMPALELERGTVLAGRYQIEAVIGSGGSGVVLRAFDRIAQTPVALKILKPELAAEPRWAERFARELRLGRQIQHPNVCRVYDIGESDGHRFLSMELATGGTLRDVRCETPTRPFAERVADARALVNGLAAIHAAGIIHRDVKPENLLRMEDGRVVVSDFGLATNPEQAPTVTVMVGTPSYMAPEMAMGDPASKTSDVWALGVTMHEILFGKRPEWSVSSSKRVLVDPCGAGSTPLERALVGLCGRCSSEVFEQRPVDACEVLRLFDELERTPGRKYPRHGGSSKRNWGWGVIATVSVVSLFAMNGKVWNRASATSTADRSRSRVIAPLGQAADWSKATVVAQLPGHVQCFSALPDGKSVRVIWGTPARAEDIEIASGRRRTSSVLVETFANGCPEVSPRGDGLLFSALDSSGGMQVMHARALDGSDARPLTKGSEPTWLPNGEEFIFNLDDVHAARFAIPTMSFNIVSDGESEIAKGVAGAAVSPGGDVFALMYQDERANRTLVIHSLPGLKTVARYQLPGSTRRISFDQLSGRVQVALHETRLKSRLADFDWRSGEARNVAAIPGSDIVRTVPIHGAGLIVLSQDRASDAWLYGHQGSIRQLTSDGETYSAAISKSGDMLLSKRRDNDHYTISRYRADGALVGTSTGVRDVMPAFSEDGKHWTYVSYDDKAIVRCASDTGKCDLLHSDDMLPAWPQYSPDGKHIAYVTQLGTPRLRVVAVGGGSQLDLGPARAECAPVWATPQSLWFYDGTQKEPRWSEVNPVTSIKSGRQRVAPTGPGQDNCSANGEGVASPFFRRIRVQERESSTLRRVSH